jgi:hypothetical protein
MPVDNKEYKYFQHFRGEKRNLSEGKLRMAVWCFFVYRVSLQQHSSGREHAVEVAHKQQ